LNSIVKRMPFERQYLNLNKILRHNNKISGRNRFLDFIKTEINIPNGLVIPSNVNLKEFLQGITVMSHNMALNGFISEKTSINSTIVIHIKLIGTLRVTIASLVVKHIWE